MLISTKSQRKSKHFFLLAVRLRQCHQIVFPRCRLQVLDSGWKTSLWGQRWGHSNFWHGRIFLSPHHEAVAVNDSLLHEVYSRGFSSSIEADPLNQLLAGSQQSFDDPATIHEGEGPRFAELPLTWKHDFVRTRASRHFAERIRRKSRQHDRHQEKSR